MTCDAVSVVDRSRRMGIFAGLGCEISEVSTIVAVNGQEEINMMYIVCIFIFLFNIRVGVR